MRKLVILAAAAAMALTTIDSLVSRLSYLKSNPRYRSEASRISGAARTLSCSRRKLDVIEYKCATGSRNAAETFPIFGKEVRIYESFLNNHPKRIVGMLIHEATHKCGTTDIAYFDSWENVPRNVGVISWDKIADTYEYWSEYRFCIPGVDCR